MMLDAELIEHYQALLEHYEWEMDELKQRIERTLELLNEMLENA